jgi:multisubunit Na+/H+ antiporter MnhB subunit
MPFAEITKDGTVFIFNLRGILLEGNVLWNGIAILILVGIILFLQVYAILKYKNRPSQIRLIKYSILGLVVLFGIFFITAYYSFNREQTSFKISHVFPVIAIILNYLAMSAIKKDEALIRSIDRIR